RGRGGCAPLGQTPFQRGKIGDRELHFDFEHGRPRRYARWGEPVRMMPLEAVAVQPVFGKGVMAEFQTVCRVGDLQDGEGRAFEVGTKLVAVFRDGGQYYAIDDVGP